jgi:hypothetical protein
LAGEDAKPARVIAGQSTLLSRTMHDIRYDPVNDELLVTNPFGNAILVFRGGADGEEAPIRIIQGPNTQLVGNTDRLDVDPVHNEIYVPLRNAILVFPRDGEGDVPPKRVIRGPRTRMTSVASVVVDAVNDRLVVGNYTFVEEREVDASGFTPEGMNYGDPGGGGLLTFNRTDQGDVAPRTMIRGPKSGIWRINQIQVQPTKRLIVATQPGKNNVEEPEGIYVGIWGLDDNGDVPPRWRLAGPKSLIKKPRGVVLDPKHKELIVADMRLNAVLTYYFPEIF